MKEIRLTVEVEGNELFRKYEVNEETIDDINWSSIVRSMLDTIEQSKLPL